jgi:uncharacterized protein (DUF2132 family)
MAEEQKPQANNPLHGVTLEAMLTDLVAYVGWEKMAAKVPINCFMHEPSIKSSLAFLRKTLWARQKVEVLYQNNLSKIAKGKGKD